MTVFPESSLAAFAGHYPEVPHKLGHALGAHPLLELDALATLAEALPPASIEYNFANLPIGIEGKPDPTGIPIGETIRRIEQTGSWAALKNIEQVPAYRDLLHALLAELRATIEPRTGAMLKLQGFIFITSPHGVTPYHFDPEHNILLQIRGRKVMTQFPAGDPRYAPDEVHETYHVGGGRELVWRARSYRVGAGGRARASDAGRACGAVIAASAVIAAKYFSMSDAVAIMTDMDNSGRAAKAWYGDIEFRAAP